MTRAMPDSVSPGRLPGGYLAYLGYVDGLFVTVPTLHSKFPGRKVVGLTVTGATVRADGIDCEPGNPDAAAAAAWVQRKHAASPGSRPIVYADLESEGYSMTEVIAELAALGITRGQVRLLTAHYTKTAHICGPQTCAGRDASGAVITFTADGTQWTDEFAGLGGPIDMSLLSDGFFSAPVPAQWTEFDMSKLPVLKTGDADKPGSFFHVHRLQALTALAGALNGLHAAAGLTGDGVFGAATDAAVRAVQAHYGITEDGIAGRQTWSVLLTGSPG